MPLNPNEVGNATKPFVHDVDARWTMAYAASLNDYNPLYMDTAAHQVLAHPLFPVCPEWPVILDARNLETSDKGNTTLTSEEGARGVHAAHDLHIYRPINAGEKIATQATMIGIRTIKPGAAYTMRLDTTNADSGELLARTYQLGIYRGVEVSGPDNSCETPPELPPLASFDDNPSTEIISTDVPIDAGAAHTYTECAHIWNPIHTDRAVALAAGLPDIILHGTATMALAVSQIVDQYADADPRRVARIGGRFSAMVLMPSTIKVQSRRNGDVVSYRVLTEHGDNAISAGYVCLR